MKKEPTCVQSNRGHKETDDFITLKYVIPLLTDTESRNRLIAEHRANPVGVPAQNGAPAIEHSHDLRTVLDKFRRAPMKNKYVVITKERFADYRIGIVSGYRGYPVEILDESFSSFDACEHGIFLKRVADLLDEYA